MNDEQPQQENLEIPQPEMQTPSSENMTPEPKTKSKKRLILICIALLLLVVGLVYVMFGDKLTDKQPDEENQPVSSSQEEQSLSQSRWIYTNEQEKQVYVYDSSNNKSTPLLKLEEGEKLSVSPDGKTLLRTRKNIVESAVGSENPEFKKIYEDSDISSSVTATWLPDSSGFIVNSGKLLNPEDENGDYWIPSFMYTVSMVSADGTDTRKLFEYPVTWGGIVIKGVDLERDELYLSEDGEGGLRVGLGIYKLSDGTKVEHDEFPSDSGILPVAKGKAYAAQTLYNSSKIRAKIIEINLDNDEQKVIYESEEIEEREFQRNGTSFVEGISILNLKLSEDKTKLYFNEVHNAENLITKLNVINLSNGSVDTLYEPTTEGNYFTFETQTASSKGLMTRISCGGCTTDDYNKFGNEWVFIDPTSGNRQTIQKTDGDTYLSAFGEINF